MDDEFMQRYGDRWEETMSHLTTNMDINPDYLIQFYKDRIKPYEKK